MTGQQVTLNQADSTGAAGSVVVASAIEAVRDTTGITNTAVHGDSYSYDLDGNTTSITGTAGNLLVQPLPQPSPLGKEIIGDLSLGGLESDHAQ